MIGILLLIGPIATAWNLMWRLAKDYNRAKFGYAFLGVGVYIGSQILLGFILGMVLVMMEQSLEILDNFLVTLGGVIFGLLLVWLMHHLLKRSWEKKRLPQEESQLLDDLSDSFQ